MSLRRGRWIWRAADEKLITSYLPLSVKDRSPEDLLKLYVPRPRNLPFLDHRERVIDVNRTNLVPACRSQLLAVIPAMHVIDHVFDKLDPCALPPVPPFPMDKRIGRMQILNQVKSTLPQEREQRVKAGALVGPIWEPSSRMMSGGPISSITERRNFGSS
jgi:hypothetical protein